jgi:putative hydrolase of the HAD superfamily
MVIKIVYFDWGDVLGGNGDPQLFSHLTQKLGLPKPDIDTIVSEELTPFFKGKITEQAFWSAVCERASYTGDRAPFDELFKRFYHPVLFPRPEVLDVAAHVRSAGTPTGILSNLITPLAAFCRENNYFASFNPIVVSSEIGHMKPEERIYATALERAALSDASTVLFVDNNPAYLAAARAFGFRTVLYDNRRDPITDLKDNLRDAGVLP